LFRVPPPSYYNEICGFHIYMLAKKRALIRIFKPYF
jgi:hypothetical protein